MKKKLTQIKTTLNIILICAVFSGFLFPDPVLAANAWSIRQEINITDGYFAAQANQVATSSAIILYDSSRYSGTQTIYFEAVASTSASFSNTITLRKKGTGTDDCTITVPSGTTSYTLLRSSACTLPKGQIEYIVRISSSASGVTGVKAARLIVLQSFSNTDGDAATSTQTQIEIGNEETYSSTATSTFASPKYWTYDSNSWDGSATFYAEVTYSSKNTVAASSTLYSTAGTYTVNIPSNTARTDIQLWGGGGAGGASTGTVGGDGGAGGQYASSTFATLAGISDTLIVAASQAGGAGAGNNGNDSTWATNVVVAKGGTGGQADGVASTTGSSTGCVSNASCFAGGSGGKGATYGAGGGGGAGTGGAGNSATGAGVAGTARSFGGGAGGTKVTTNTAGSSGSAAGGGGSGGLKTTGATKNGGTGAAGQALVVNYLTGTTTITVQQDNGSFASWTDVAYIVTGGGSATSTRVRSNAFTPVNGRHYRLAFVSKDSRGTYAIYNAKIIVNQTDTRSWAQAGNKTAISGVTIPGIATLSTSTVVLAEDTGKQIRTYTWDGTNWSQVGNGLTVTGMSVPTIATLSSNQIAYNDYANDQLRTYSFDGTNWSLVGSGLSIPSAGSKYLAALNSTDVVYLDNALDTIQAYRFDGSTWSTLGNDVSAACTGFPSIAKLSSTRVVVACDMTLRAYDFDGTDWTRVGNIGTISGMSGGAPTLTGLNVSSVAYIDSTIDSLRTYYFDGTNWSNIGTNLSITSGNPAITSLTDSTVAFIEDTGDALTAYTDYNAGTTFTKTEPQYLLANTKLSSGTNLQNFLTKWDSSEWSGVNNTYLHAVDSANGSASVVTLNTVAGTLLTGSTVTSPSNQSTSTSVTMPSNGNIDTKATTNNNDVYASRILVQASQNVITTMTFSGKLYETDESTAIATVPTVKLSINGGTSVSATADGSGNFSFTGITIPSVGDIVTVWISGATEKGTLVFRYGSSCTGYNDCTGLSIYRDEVIVDSKDGSALTNTNLASCDNDSGTGCNTADIGFTSNSGTLTLASGRTLRIKDVSAVFSPGGGVVADKIKQSDGTVNGGTGTITFGDFILSGGTFNSTSGTMNVNGLSTSLYTSWNHTGGTFNNNNGTVVRGGNSNTTWDFPTTETFYNFTANMSGNSELDIASGDTMVVTNTLTHANGNLNGPGSIEVQGNMVVTGTTSSGGNANISFLISGDQTITGGTGAQTASLVINKPAGSVIAGGELSIADFTLQSGTFIAPSQTLYVRGKSASIYTSWNHTGGTFNNNSGTVVRTSNSNTTWDFPTTETFYNFTNDITESSELDIATGDTMIVTGTYTNTRGYLNGPGTLEVQGNIVISSTAQGGTANVNLTGATAQTLTNSGGTANTGMFSITKTNNSDTITLASNFTFANGIVVNKGTFSQGSSYNFTTASTTYIGANGTWSNIGTGDVVLGGNVTNAGIITLNSNNGSQCSDGTDDISITSSVGGTQRTWSGAGTFNLYNVAVTDMLGSLTAYTSTFTNSNWTNGVCSISISGTVYTDEGVTTMGSGRTVRVKVNGSGTYSTTTASNGTYTITGVPYGAADILTIYLDGATEKAVVITRNLDAYATTLTNINLYQNFVIVRNESTTVITNANLGVFDTKLDGDISFYVQSGVLNVISQNTLYVQSGTYSPGGDITTNGLKQVGGTFNGGSGSITVSGSGIRGFVLTGGTFNSTSGTLAVWNSSGSGVGPAFTHVTGGTFNHNNGTVRLGNGGTSSYCGTIDVSTTETFNNLILYSDVNNNCVISSGDTLVVLGTYTQTQSGFDTGTIEPRGSVVIGANAKRGGGTLSFLVSGDQSITSSGGFTSKLYINKPSGTVSLTGNLGIRSLNLASGIFTSTSNTLTVGAVGDGEWTNSGGTFNHNNGTVKYGGYSTTWDVNSTETFYNLEIDEWGSTNIATGSPLTIASGDTLVVLGTYTLTDGVVDGGTIEPRGNIVIGSQADGGTVNLNLTGSTSQTFTNNGGTAPTGMVTINKTNSTDTVTLASNYTFSNGLVVTSGVFSQGASYNFTTASTTYIGVNGSWVNTGTGGIVLGGNVINAGTITLNSNSGGLCSNVTDDIAITSSVGGTQRTWSGGGTFTLYNVAVTDMLGALTAYNSTFSNSNWSNGSTVGCGASRGGGGVSIDGGGSGGGNQVTGGTSGGGATNGGGSGGGGIKLATDLTEGGTSTYTGTACAGSETGDKAYDNSSGTKWCVVGDPSIGTPISTMYDFSGTTAYAVNSYTITTANDVAGRDPKDWTVQGCQGSCVVGSDAGWTILDTRINQFATASRFETQSFTFANSTAYQQYRLRFTSSQTSPGYFQFSEWQLFIVSLGGGGGGGGSATP